MEYPVDQALLEAMGRQALCKLSRFTPQALSNTLWSLSKLGISDGHLFSAVAQGAVKALPFFNGQNVANALWAFANVQLHPGAEALELYAERAIQIINQLTPQNLSNTVRCNVDTLGNAAASCWCP